MLNQKQLANQEKYLPIVAKAFAAEGLPPELGAAIARQESVWSPDVSTMTGGDGRLGGSFGLCQMSLATGGTLDRGVTPGRLLDPAYNAKLAAKLCKRNWNIAHGRIQDVISMYNSGRQFHTAPEVTKLVYVPNVQRYMEEYKVTCASYAVCPVPSPGSV